MAQGARKHGVVSVGGVVSVEGARVIFLRGSLSERSQALSCTPKDEPHPLIESVVRGLALAHGSKACRYLAECNGIFGC
jgi:hypothetical protein